MTKIVSVFVIVSVIIVKFLEGIRVSCPLIDNGFIEKNIVKRNMFKKRCFKFNLNADIVKYSFFVCKDKK